MSDLPRSECRIIEDILRTECYYARLGVFKDSSPNEIRRGYLGRSKVGFAIQTDHEVILEQKKRSKVSKLPENSVKTLFLSYGSDMTFFCQIELSNAYQTLSDPYNRRAYDLYGRQVDGSEQTFSDAVQQVFQEFLDGHFDTFIRVVDYLQSLNPEFKISKDGTRSVLNHLRDFCLWSKKGWDAAKFEIIHLYELQEDLRCCSYWDVPGRLRRAAQLSKGILQLLGKILPGGSFLVQKQLTVIDRMEVYLTGVSPAVR
ncbi:hypothetical protein HK104_008322 [Borealophlyctis nickersoniae]|nr:hypothetical protein HK104_008322 [Borealophlyctis nickersoniae]